MKYFTISATVALSLLFCVLSCNERKREKQYTDLYGGWKIADFHTEDSGTDLALVVMALSKVFPDSMRFTADSLFIHVAEKDTSWAEAFPYVRKQDTLLVRNTDTIAVHVALKHNGDTLILAGDDYQYYLVR